MCQVNTFMFKEDELDGEKLMKIIGIFQKAGFTNFYEYNNPNLRNIRRDLRLFQCGNFCDCGSVVTKKVVVDEMLETAESQKLTEIITKTLDVVSTAYLFSHWYKGNNDIAREKVSEVKTFEDAEAFDNWYANNFLDTGLNYITIDGM